MVSKSIMTSEAREALTFQQISHPCNVVVYSSGGLSFLPRLLGLDALGMLQNLFLSYWQLLVSYAGFTPVVPQL